MLRGHLDTCPATDRTAGSGFRIDKMITPYLAAHYLHHLLGSPFASIDELPTSISPIEVAGALPGKDLKRKYIEHNRHVMVIYDFNIILK